MDWISRFNDAMDYVESHLTEELNCEKIAETADCPAYYFQRMFFYMTNLTLHEYIRRRRLSLAAVELQSGNQKVIDISLKYGYESPTAFNRAFKKFHGVAPSRVKEGKAAFCSYPPIRFSLSVQGGKELNVRIEEKAAFRILGVTCPLDEDIEKNFRAIPNRWNQAVSKGTIRELLSMMEGSPDGLLGLSVHFTKNRKYFIAVSTTVEDSKYEEYEIPACTWAVFSGQGTNYSLQDLERRVIVEWLPTSGYQCADVPDVERYIKADPEDAVYEYWLPIKRKEE